MDLADAVFTAEEVDIEKEAILEDEDVRIHLMAATEDATIIEDAEEAIFKITEAVDAAIISIFPNRETNRFYHVLRRKLNRECAGTATKQAI